MFFYASKFLWLLVAPTNLMIGLVVLGVVALVFGARRIGLGFCSLAALGFLVFGLGPGASFLLRPLEDRFPQPKLEGRTLKGIIVLGGGVDEATTAARGMTTLSEAGTRMTEGVALARRFPGTQLVFTGGSASVTGRTEREADVARRLFRELGVPDRQAIYEDRSRNTQENADFTRDLVKPKAGETWLLVTSAYHMPRSMGLFRRAGFDVLAYPTDYQTSGSPRDFMRINLEASIGLRHTDKSVREWIGLIAYRLSGKTDELLPGPR